MRSRVVVVATLLTLGVASYGQLHPRDPDDDKLPSGKSQREEIMKAEYEKALKDAAELSKLADDLKSELEKNDSHVLSVNALKQLDSIEKLTKKIRGRLKRF
jgi:hypothetical protein